ncbi:hypothetical protein PORY_001639 [Pneumocystis oryctolagi]|uniref:Uncharacterized protein n=1 Tax=Pneumocystis oryctolagi TaxID=42067 RepID=A0ACB7CDM0_9ASCO|nr:hypothetical protein PORY_001639 [Pneumocystis oryctolagi]
MLNQYVIKQKIGVGSFGTVSRCIDTLTGKEYLQRPSVKTHTTQTTSQQLIQTMIEASFGCILYVRGLFPDDNFSEERYNQKLNKPSTPMNSGTRIMKIKRGFSEEADLLLDYLNQGVYDALSKKYLRSILFAIYFDPNDSTNIFESYTFNFAYYGQDKKPIMNVINSKGEKQSFGVEEEYAKRCIQLLLRNLITLTQNLSPLPGKYITMKLFYTDTTPHDYQPPMFRDCTMEKPFTFAVDPENTSFYKQTAGSMDTGFHAITLKITSIADAVSECKSYEEYYDKQIKTLSAEEDSPEAKTFKISQGNNEVIILNSPKKTQSFTESLHSMSQKDLHNQLSPKYINEQYEKENAAIKEMLITPVQDSGLEATQPLESNLSQLTQNPTFLQSKLPFENDNVKTKNFKIEEISEDLSINENSITKGVSKLILNLQKEIELNEERKRLNYLKTTTDETNDDMSVIRCECGDIAEDSGDMIQCYVCQAWVHAWCYGFISGNDERLPDDHSCYSCLLQKSEPALYESMKDLALFRRALMIVWEEGLPRNIIEFSDRLGCSKQNANQILKRLLQEGFIVDITSNRTLRSNITKKNNGRLNINEEMAVAKTPENKQRLFSEYFQPLLKISHHYKKQEKISTPQKDKCLNTNTFNNDSMFVDTLSTSDSCSNDLFKKSSFSVNTIHPLSQSQNTEITNEVPIKETNDTNDDNVEPDTTDDEDLSTHDTVKTKPYLKESTILMNCDTDFNLQKRDTINNLKSCAASTINQIPKKNDKRTRLHLDKNFEIEAKKRKSSVILKPILV